MKAKIIYTLIVCTTCIASTFVTIKSYKSNRSAIMNLAFNNIQALAEYESDGGDGGEGEDGGVSTMRCGKNLEPSSDDAFHYKCNSNTTTNRMYKCPGSLSKGAINPFEDSYSCML